MTDEQIRVELARRVHGWKIVPDKEDRIAFFRRDENFPCYDPRTKTVCEKTRVTPWRDWNPLEWNDAMGLAEKWAVGEGGDWYDIEWLPQIGYHVYLFPPNQMDGTDFTSAIHKSGPRAVCMAVAKAAGIEVES